MSAITSNLILPCPRYQTPCLRESTETTVILIRPFTFHPSPHIFEVHSISFPVCTYIVRRTPIITRDLFFQIFLLLLVSSHIYILITVRIALHYCMVYRLILNQHANTGLLCQSKIPKAVNSFFNLRISFCNQVPHLRLHTYTIYFICYTFSTLVFHNRTFEKKIRHTYNRDCRNVSQFDSIYACSCGDPSIHHVF